MLDNLQKTFLSQEFASSVLVQVEYDLSPTAHLHQQPYIWQLP